MADRTVVLSQNGRHAVRGLSVNNPSEFSAYQDDDDDLTYVVDLSAYLDGDTITVVTRVPQGVFISNSSNTTTRLTQRLRGFGYVDFKVQTSAGDVEEFRVNILRRTGSKVVLGASGGGGTAVIDGNYGDVVVSGNGTVWTVTGGTGGATDAQTFDTVSAVNSATIDAAVNHIRTAGYYANGDGGGALYKRSAGTPTGVGTKYITSNGGAVVWELVADPQISIRQFGAKGDGVANDTASFDAALTHLRNLGGGALYIPAGTYKLHTAIAIPPAGSGWHNLLIKGDGPSTVLDFAPAGAGTSGLQITGWGGRFALEDFQVKAAKNIGISVNHGVSMGGVSWISRFSLSRIIVDGSVSHGIRMANAYMGSIRDVECRNNGGDGFHLHGNFTSMNFERCWAGGDAASPNGGNTGNGWFINGMIYSTFADCSADWSGAKGWVIKNTCATNLINCGAESNSQEGFYLQSGNDSDRSGSAIPDIYGLSLSGLKSFDNSRAGVGLYSNLLAALAQNSRAIVFSLKGCYSRNTLGTTVAMTLNGSAGPIEVIQENLATEGGTTSKSGDVRLKNINLSGRSSIADLVGNQSTTDSTDTKINFTNFLKNGLGCTFNSGAIVVPANVSRIKVTGNVWWASSSTGIRTLEIRINDLSVAGGGFNRVSGTGNTQQNVSSAILDVVSGDMVSLYALQTSGGNLDIVDNQATWLSVECIE